VNGYPPDVAASVVAASAVAAPTGEGGRMDLRRVDSLGRMRGPWRLF
jgi:hypothetical protein